MTVSLCAYFSLIMALWFGWQTTHLFGEGGGSLPLKCFYAFGVIAFFLCFVGLKGRKIWAWILFLVLIMRLILHNLVAVYVFLYRLTHEGVFSVKYEAMVGIMLVAIIGTLYSLVWFLTKPVIWGEFESSTNRAQNQFHRFGDVSLAAVIILSIENLFSSDIGWGLALILMSITIGISWLLILWNSRSQ